MEKKRNYNEAQLKVVRLNGKSTLLSGSSPVSGSSGAPGLTMNSYTAYQGGAVFE